MQPRRRRPRRCRPRRGRRRLLRLSAGVRLRWRLAWCAQAYKEAAKGDQARRSAADGHVVDLARANSVSTACVARRSLLGFLLLPVVAVPAVLGSSRVESQLRLALAQLGDADRGWIALAGIRFAGALRLGGLSP